MAEPVFDPKIPTEDKIVYINDAKDDFDVDVDVKNLSIHDRYQIQTKLKKAFKKAYYNTEPKTYYDKNVNRNIRLFEFPIRSAILVYFKVQKFRDETGGQKLETWEQPHISNWDVSRVTDMSNLFNYEYYTRYDVSPKTEKKPITSKTVFETILGRKNVNKAQDKILKKLFQEFNENISSWNVSNVTNMEGMFKSAWKFNQDISKWNVSNVTNMKDMFKDTDALLTGNVPLWYKITEDNKEGIQKGINNEVLVKSGDVIKRKKPQQQTFNEKFNPLKYLERSVKRGNQLIAPGDLGFPLRKIRNYTRERFGPNPINIPKKIIYKMVDDSEVIEPITIRDGNEEKKIYDYKNIYISLIEQKEPIDRNGVQVIRVPIRFAIRETIFRAKYRDDKNREMNWDVSEVTDMSNLFNIKYYYNTDEVDDKKISSFEELFSSFIFLNLSNWNVSNVTNMEGMFKYVRSFNQDISRWNVKNVTNMSEMFYGARSFNQPISKWDVSKVTNMEGMFNYAWKFNQDISEWDVSKVTNMKSMFHGASRFNQDITQWNVSNVTNMEDMFKTAWKFNKDISQWNVSKVTNMKHMFYEAKAFNQDIYSWGVSVSKETNMEDMFKDTEVLKNNKLPYWYNQTLTDEEFKKIYDSIRTGTKGGKKRRTRKNIIKRKNTIKRKKTKKLRKKILKKTKKNRNKLKK